MIDTLNEELELVKELEKKAPKNMLYVNAIMNNLIKRDDKEMSQQVLSMWQNNKIGYAELGYIDHTIKNNIYNWNKAKKKHPNFDKTINVIKTIREFIRADIRITELVRKYKK